MLFGPGESPYDERVSKDFAILDSRATPLGEITLRRRRIPMLGDVEVFEVKLGEAFLMSSLFHEVEVALARLGLASLDAPSLDVVVGGLGLGYTAVAALEHTAVRSLLVVEALDPVIDWHRQGLVPLGTSLTGDARCRFIHGDFFALAQSPEQGFDPAQPGRRFHAVLLDIDHSPSVARPSRQQGKTRECFSELDQRPDRAFAAFHSCLVCSRQSGQSPWERSMSRWVSRYCSIVCQ